MRPIAIRYTRNITGHTIATPSKPTEAIKYPIYFIVEGYYHIIKYLHVSYPHYFIVTLWYYMTSDIRSGQQQMNEEIADIYLRMTDPEEREKEQMKKEERQNVELTIIDAGL